MFITLIIILSVYLLVIAAFTRGFIKTKSQNVKSENKTFISLIVPFRNEKNNLPELIKSLKKQTYSEYSYEIIFVNDHSTDDSCEIIRQSNFNCTTHLLHLTDKNGKKSALDLAIKNANGNLAVTTDADCVLQPKWLEKINDFYNLSKAKMIIMPAKYTTTSKLITFENIQALEFASLQASTIGSAGIGLPIMCNGANLAFEKQVYFEFNDATKSELTSGDDTFLMFSIQKKYKNKILFLKNPETIVETKPCKSFKEFYNQRIRWASKTKFYTDFFTIFVAFTIFLVNISILITLILGLFKYYFLKLFVFSILFKTIVEIPLMYNYLHFVKQTKLIFIFLPVQFVYIFYIAATTILSLFKSFSWKGRLSSK